MVVLDGDRRSLIYCEVTKEYATHLKMYYSSYLLPVSYKIKPNYSDFNEFKR